ncbi:MAG: alpha/beta fold hydrolase [Anaerolineae bacterium]|nr:alpha/beta fold hydrolase [Anaerolineae bacterium]
MDRNQMVIPTAEPFLFQGDSVGCILVHGFTGTPKEMRWMGEYFANLGRTVLGVRLTGHATQPADMVRTKWWDWLASVEDSIHLLRNNCDHVFMMGLSMGGALTLLAAARYPLDGIIAMSTPHALPTDPRLRLLPILKYLVPEVPKGPSDWHDLNNIQDHVSYPKYPTPCIPELLDLLAEMRSSLPQINTPVLLMQSRQDVTIPKESMKFIFDHVASPIKEMMWLENSGHVITREPPRLQVYQAAENFINRILSKESEPQ